MDKATIRKNMRRRRRDLPHAVRQQEEGCACAAIRTLIDESAITAIGSYMALGGELDLEQLHHWCWQAGCALWLPRVLGDISSGRMVWSQVRGPEELVRSQAGICEPSDALTAVDLPPVDCLLVPGVAFTKAGHRLGQGGGFYDRALAALPAECVTVGLAFSVQVCECLPTEAHDKELLRLCVGGQLLDCTRSV